jgi:N,N'-diacetyllegionaminate synthase
MSVYIIAEAGVNHNGNPELAKNMIDKAKEAGADCIKFQTFISKNIVTKNANKAEYQLHQTDANENQLAMLQKLEMSFDDFIELDKYCKAQGIKFLSTPFDFESIEFLASINMEMWKIPSGEITNLPYLIRIAKMHKPIILSTGMSSLKEVEEAMNVLRKNGSGEITLLHCTTEYPAPYTDVNLKAMDTLKEKFHVPLGYSDHTKGIEISIAAVAMGATVIEKHFTLDRNMEGPDHKASLEPSELKAMVRAIRNVELAIGSGRKTSVESEQKNIIIARKSIVASQSIKKGDIFTEDNLTVKRPGNGISPMRWFEVLGQEAIRDFEEDELIVL